ncbi:MAG: hypothetical protein DI595_01200 [Agrobacterium fabrum]|uniref:Uncharacterized protein n=1 Tax=Agrobacterium fabrum TaxID=1176649 RepID=A0A2W5FDF9_9HYPH|nr:MAG: hypothetical protein DI595_01200 [Agrobacterium fabrum]
MWKPTLSIAIALTLASSALAIGRYDTQARSCQRVQELLKQEKQAILRYPSRNGRMTLYDRYVSNAAECGPGKYGLRASVPTADGVCGVVSCRPLSDFAP